VAPPLRPQMVGCCAACLRPARRPEAASCGFKPPKTAMSCRPRSPRRRCRSSLESALTQWHGTQGGRNEAVCEALLGQPKLVGIPSVRWNGEKDGEKDGKPFAHPVIFEVSIVALYGCRDDTQPRITTISSTLCTTSGGTPGYPKGYLGVPYGVPPGVPLGVPRCTLGYPLGYPRGYHLTCTLGYPRGYPQGYPPMGYPRVPRGTPGYPP